MRHLAALVLLWLQACDAHRVLLVFPAPSRSNTILGEGYVRHLLSAGHQVTYITPILVKKPLRNLRQIDVSSNFDFVVANKILHLTKIMNKEIQNLETEEILQLTLVINNATVFNEDVQKLLHDPEEKFDVVVAQWAFCELYCGIAAVFNCPLIWAATMEPHALMLSVISEDANPSYVPSYKSTTVPPFNFRHRVEELWTFINIKYHKWLTSLKETSLYEQAYSSAAAARGHSLPSYHEARYNAALMFGNSHAAAGSALSLPPNYIPIAGFHIDENVQLLPEDLKSIMDNAEHGVIFFSMGSILSSKTLSTELKSQLLENFNQLKQTVIWKLEESPGKLPKNVHLVGYAPQQSILAHPNCVLFITHGGMLSSTEALHFGVPIIGIPVFADQFPNIERAVHKGYAKKVDLNHDLPIKLREAIGDILGNPRYRARAAELSLAYHDRVTSPRRALAHWVAHVVRTRGAPHLRSPALLLPWYQKMYLDLMALVLIVVSISFIILKRCISFVKLVTGSHCAISSTDVNKKIN